MSYSEDLKKLWNYIKSGECKNNYEFLDIDYGDRYYSENGEECRLWFKDKTCYSFGYTYITEDDDDWAQAECHKSSWCHDITDPDDKSYRTKVKPSFILEKLGVN